MGAVIPLWRQLLPGAGEGEPHPFGAPAPSADGNGDVVAAGCGVGDGIAAGVPGQVDAGDETPVPQVVGGEVFLGVDAVLFAESSQFTRRLRGGDQHLRRRQHEDARIPSEKRQVQLPKGGMIDRPETGGNHPAVLSGVHVDNR